MSSAGELFVSASSEEDGALRVWDAYTGAEKWKGKGSQSQSRTLCRIGDDVLASAPLGRSEIRFWSLSKSTTLPGSGRCSTWEPLLALAATPDGMYVVGGSKSGKLYIWEVASGNLLRFWDAHYSAVSVLAISDDGLAIVSAEEHAYIKVWQLGDCLDLSDDARARDPPAYRTWTEHSLPVTDLVLGVGGGACRVYSASLDHTVRIWCTATSDRLCSIRLPAKCTSLALEPAERELFVGGSDGVVYAISLAAGPPSPEWATEAETQDQRGAAGAAFRGHRGSITALATSSDGTLLLSASADTHVRVWDVPSRQTLRIFERHGGALTNLIPLGLHTSASFGERGALVLPAMSSAAARHAAATAGVVKPFLKESVVGYGSGARARAALGTFLVPLKIGALSAPRGGSVLTQHGWGGVGGTGDAGAGLGSGWVSAVPVASWPDDTGRAPCGVEVDLSRLHRFAVAEGREGGGGAEGAGGGAPAAQLSVGEQLATLRAERDRWRGLATELYAFAGSELMSQHQHQPDPAAEEEQRQQQ